MRIIQIAPIERSIPPPRYGGIERIVHILTEGLLNRGHAVTLLASAGSKSRALLCPIIEIPLCEDESVGGDIKSRDAYFTVVTARILAQLKKYRADIIHNHMGWRLLPYWQMMPSPMLTTIQTPLESKAKRVVFREAGGAPIVSVSNNQRRALPSLNYVATVHNAVDIGKYKLGRGDGGYVAFLGRMAPEKGPLDAIRIARTLRLPLIMAAAIHPWELAYFEKKIYPEIDHKQISFIGEINDSDKNEFLGNAEALLNPIKWEEPFGITCIEAMACGTPVITLARGAMPEIVLDGITGIVAVSIEEMIGRYREVKQIDRSACRAHVETYFTADRMVENYIKVYHDFLYSPRGEE